MKTKSMNCLALKDKLQSKARERDRGLSDEQAHARRLREISTSNSPVAKLWRAAKKRSSL
jgi:hypothetical protein